ncbi:hypothetical protein KUTeg_017549 [Tegillarca granosa]|uniref:Large ribosomal subunit protein mL54 n=1 Tax=Tegillarca granosa TaxID=220873 RepID=A0ABQ9EF80_TEGGR|nr:hypothetical protein KUTeg_017549 [Tegillarca granosa]
MINTVKVSLKEIESRVGKSLLRAVSNAAGRFVAPITKSVVWVISIPMRVNFSISGTFNMALRMLKRFDIQKLCTFTRLCVARYAAQAAPPKKMGKKRFALPVETNPEILCTRLCGGNIYKEGEDPVLKEDHEYPDWLWELRIEHKPLVLKDFEPYSDGYWRKLKKLTLQEKNKTQKRIQSRGK